MYHEFDAARVKQLLGIAPQDMPRGLILHGAYNMPQHVQRWRDRLANARVATRVFNLVIGEYHGATLWYASVLGAPMAAFMVHAAAIVGVQSIIQIGSFGATRRGLAEGDLLLVTGAGRGEAASDWYLPADVPARSDERLNECLRSLLRGRGLAWHEGPVFTTPAFMAETWADIQRWASEGYAGVEMEAATTFAIAQHFGVPAACLLFLLDNLIEERHLLHHTELVRERIQQQRLLIEGLALDAVRVFS